MVVTWPGRSRGRHVRTQISSVGIVGDFAKRQSLTWRGRGLIRRGFLSFLAGRVQWYKQKGRGIDTVVLSECHGKKRSGTQIVSLWEKHRWREIQPPVSQSC